MVKNVTARALTLRIEKKIEKNVYTVSTTSLMPEGIPSLKTTSSSSSETSGVFLKTLAHFLPELCASYQLRFSSLFLVFDHWAFDKGGGRKLE